MEQLIHPDQMYCVPSRLKTDNICLIRDILDLCGSLGSDLGLISLVLHAFRFSPALIARIQVLYCNIESVLKINGGLRGPFSITRGIRIKLFQYILR